MRCPSCGAEVADPEGVYCSRCGRPLRSSEPGAPDAPGAPPANEAPSEPGDDASAADDVASRRRSEGPRATDEDPVPSPPPETIATNEVASPSDTAPIETSERAGSSRSPGAAAMATEMAGSLGRAFRSGGWPEASSAAAMGFLAVLAVGALFVGLLKLVEPSFGSDRNPFWVLTRVVVAGLASLGIPIDQGGAEGSILPMGTLVLVAWVLVWAARTVVVSGGAQGSAERAVAGAKIGAPFAILCLIAAVIFRLRDGIETGADPGLAFVIGGLWGALFGAAGGLLAGDSTRSTASTRKWGPAVVREGVVAGATMLVSAAVAAMAAALIFVILDLIVVTDVRLTPSDAVALVILLLAFAPNIAVATVAFSMGAPMEFVADSLGVGFRTDLSLFGGGSGPEWYIYFVVLIPLFACLFGGYSARRKTNNPTRIIEVIAVAAGVLSIGLSFLVYIGTLSLERGLLGPGNLLVLQPDASAVFFLSLLWAGVLGIVGWKVAESQSQHDPSGSTDTSTV